MTDTKTPKVKAPKAPKAVPATSGTTAKLTYAAQLAAAQAKKQQRGPGYKISSQSYSGGKVHNPTV